MLWLLTLMHGAVDGLCGAVLITHEQPGTSYTDILCLYALYNLIAFGGQWITGLVLDLKPAWLTRSLPVALTLLALGALPATDVYRQAVLLGLGNCLFHAAGGSLVLRSTHRFTEPGLFVASGAIGLALGLFGYLPPTCFLLTAALCTGGVLWFAKPVMVCAEPEKPAPHSQAPLLLCVALLLACVILRGFGGGGHSSASVLLFPAVFTLGKALGGVCCDFLGYNRTLLLIFLVSFLALQVEGLAGSVVFALAMNMTMPLTLRLAHFSFPAYPGLIFGLAAGCLLPGVCFGYLLLQPQPVMVAVFLCLYAAGCLYQTYGDNNANARTHHRYAA